MAKIMNWIDVQRTLRLKKILIFTPRDLMRLFSVSLVAVTFFVHRHTQKGSLIRLKKSRRGSLYVMSDRLPDPYEIANRLYDPSYVSLDTALAFHQIIPETVYGVTSVTTRTTREFQAAQISYRYSHIKKEIFTGYRPLRYRDRTILMAEPEKALTDYLYFVERGQRSLSYERMDLSSGRIDRAKLVKYLKLCQRPRLIRLWETLYAHNGQPARIR